eukprot:2276787-Pyramimonas_sp.AAC.1
MLEASSWRYPSSTHLPPPSSLLLHPCPLLSPPTVRVPIPLLGALLRLGAIDRRGLVGGVTLGGPQDATLMPVARELLVAGLPPAWPAARERLISFQG